MSNWAQAIITIVCTLLASSGMWAYFEKRTGRANARDSMLLGLAHDRILYLGSVYLTRGKITRDEYENLVEYLYKPYRQLGGNGAAKHVIDLVDKLPVVNDSYLKEV